MQEWAEANPVLVKELAGSRGMPVSYADKVAPRSAEEAVPALMETAESPRVVNRWRYLPTTWARCAREPRRNMAHPRNRSEYPTGGIATEVT